MRHTIAELKRNPHVDPGWLEFVLWAAGRRRIRKTPPGRSRWLPHQGKREMARRLAQKARPSRRERFEAKVREFGISWGKGYRHA